MYDIIIIGGGPAGSTLARLLGGKHKILLLDKRELISPKISHFTFRKCCGGLVAPDAQYMLAKMGLGVPREVLVGPQLFTVRTIDIQNNIERYYQRHYINVDREKFDSWLVSLIPSEVDIRCSTLFKSYEIKDGLISVKLITGGREYSEKTKFLVGADGANSLLRRQLTGRKFEKTYISIQEWYKEEQSQPYFSAIFDNSVSDYYSWTIPKEEYLIVGAALMPGKNVERKFKLLKEKLIIRGFNFDRKAKKHGAFMLRPLNAGQVFLGEGGIAFAGEAAGWISPTSAEGISYAFRSAIALAESFKSSPEKLIEKYCRKTKGLRINIMQKNLKSPFMYNPFIRRLVMKSGFLSMSIYK